MLGIRVAGRTVTRVWDRALHEERSFLYVPAFSIAEWIVGNWWVLLNEPCPTPVVPRASGFHLPWIKRHCLRCADSALLLPALYFFNDGRGIGVEWQADPRDTLPHMPGEFVDGNRDHLDSVVTENALREFVSTVLTRVENLAEARVQATLATWHAIGNVDADEAKFCIAAGRLGIDPYDPGQIPEDLAGFLETGLGDPSQPLVRDLTEAAEPESIAGEWSWVQETSKAFHLGPSPAAPGIALPAVTNSPFRYGYQLAARVREKAGLPPADPVPSDLDVAQRVAGAVLETPDQNHVPGRKLRAVVGWKGNREIVIAGPRPPRHATQRFLDARGLYHALFTCDSTQRLVTGAYTWDQQASRAFAAELLAPRAALSARTTERADHAEVEQLAQEFLVSTKVIENQLENAGVVVVDE
jgi:Zn-dependent peptidase ImmA (M78 family)